MAWGRRAVALMAVLGGFVAAPTANAGQMPVNGTWQQLVNCAPTDYDPVTGRIHCLGSSMWQGTWTGVTNFEFDGTYDINTGDTQGTARETFHGQASDGTSGDLYVLNHIVADGETDQFRDEVDILGGTDGFAGSKGHVLFTGRIDETSGGGEYRGKWVRPGAPHRCQGKHRGRSCSRRR
jgi:hypothetical protein